MQRSQRFSWTTWEGCCCHCQETWPHVWNLVLTFNHIVKHWYHVLHDTLYCLLHRSCSSKGVSIFSLLNLPPFPSAWFSTPIHALHWWKDTALSRITSQISHPSEVHCSLECLYNLSDMSETDMLDFPIFRTWYPPEQNTAAFHYKPDEKVKFQPHIQHRQHKDSVRSEWAHNSRRKSRYYLSYVIWTEQRMQIFT